MIPDVTSIANLGANATPKDVAAKVQGMFMEVMLKAIDQANKDLGESIAASDKEGDGVSPAFLSLQDSAAQLAIAVEEIARMLRKSARPDIAPAHIMEALSPRPPGPEEAA